MNEAERALDLFRAGYNCSQAVLAAHGPELGLDKDACLKVASAFGGGIARTAGTCGAVTGALMVIGLRHGGITIEDPTRKAEVYEKGQEFMRRFAERNGSVVCRDLLGCDISTPEGRQQAKERSLHATRCEQLLRDAAELLAEE